MNDQQKSLLIESIVQSLELPDSAYEKAKSRYEDIGEWFGRDESQFKGNKPHIFPQGSFRLGTAIYPIDKSEPYDLDLACELQVGITKRLYTQQLFKSKMGKEIEDYRVAKGIKAPKEEKHRCWRLNYADAVSFHIDVVPCIPADASRMNSILESMRKFGENEFVAASVSKLTVSITDDQHPQYPQICDQWYVSNPEGYAKWFEFRMKQAQRFLNEKVALFKAADIDKLPTFMWKTPLQRCIQILKRHRDIMFRDQSELKPISVIITTLAAKAYSGETDLNQAMRTILAKMGEFVNSDFPKVPNPVNPGGEDFAEKWATDRRLEENFWAWLQQAENDFKEIGDTMDTGLITGQISKKYSVNLNESGLRKRLGLADQPTDAALKYSGPIVVTSKPSGRHYSL